MGGVWEAKKIANPEYEDDDTLYKYDAFGFIGFDLWQVKGGTIFDNVIITDDVAEADAFAKKWKTLSELEKSKKARRTPRRKRRTTRRLRRTSQTMTTMMTRRTRKNPRKCEVVGFEFALYSLQRN